MQVRLWKVIVSVVCALRVSPALAESATPPPTYAAETIELVVVDEETGQPLEGVNIVAHWELQKGHFESMEQRLRMMQGSHTSQFMILEGVTDQHGRLVFPAWGPKPRPTGWYLMADSPWIVVFKRGYKYRLLTDQITTEAETSPVLRSEWHGKTVKLTKLFRYVEEFPQELFLVTERLHFALEPDGNCYWKQIPRTLVALAVESARLAKARGETDPILLSPHRLVEYWEDYYGPSQAQKCGSIKEFLRSYLP